MTLLNKKYHKLAATDDYLLDPVVFAQAWKKSNQHIRMTNWYANTFELDRVTVDIDSNLSNWLDTLKEEQLSFTPLKLIPAPKTARWGFVEVEKTDEAILNRSINEGDYSHDWQPIIKDGEEIKTLRPLAHIGIKEQTIFTSLMMCLADTVETLQGDSTTIFDEVHSKRVVNYGNRLFCQFTDNKAQFSWGNSTTYSKFFVDYRKFLERSRHFGNIALSQRMPSENVYEIHLDLEKFFDCIIRVKLIERIKALIEPDPFKRIKSPLASKDYLTKMLDAFNRWEWDDASPKLYEEVCATAGRTLTRKGIPQGLVAGGFLANIYMLDFDAWFSALIGKDFADNIHLADYSRYVDDMRVIVVAKSGFGADKVKEIIEDKINEQLKGLNLKLNDTKTLVERFAPKRGGISQKLNDIQKKVSGPISLNEIDEHLGHLEGLVTLSAQLTDSSNTSDNTNPLATIEKPLQDVREDTLLRFCANKIHTLLKQKRSMVAQEVDADGNPIPGAWDYLQEHMARKFISAWSRDPSLVLLLKKGLEFFPSKALIKTVFEQLLVVLDRTGKESQVACYCLCEIYRHTATVIHSKDRWAFPAHAEVDEYFEYLQNEAITLLDNETFGSLAEQARFYCLVRNDSPLDKDTSDENFNVINKLMKGYRNISTAMTRESFVANSILAFQMGNDEKAVIKAISCLLEKISAKNVKDKSLSRKDVKPYIKKISVESPELFNQLAAYAKSQSLAWIVAHKTVVVNTGFYQKSITAQLNKLTKPVPLLGIIKRHDNPFRHENAVLKLLATLLAKGDELFDQRIDILNSKISCDNWEKLQSLDVELTLEATVLDITQDAYPIPEWVKGEPEHIKLFHVGTFLRSCLIGKLDWTAFNAKSKVGSGYKGINTSFAKRKLGMMHSAEALGGHIAPMSNWLSSLLFRLLQWPGVQVGDTYNWPKHWDLNSLKGLIDKRIEEQKELYCKLTEMPGYIERVDLGWDKDKSNLNVVMVQSLLPLKEDFSKYGFLLDSNNYRAKHRRHIASVAELILHKINSQNSIDDDKYKKTDVDLIVWPELAVNIEDIDILEQLADKTGAMIFTGLTFMNLENIAGPNNVGMWLIPNKQKSGRQFIRRLQGKQNMMADEKGHAIPWRPYQLFIELVHPSFPNEQGFKLTGSICYDATDIKLSADLKDKSDAFIVPALNKDVATFDSMVDSLYYHMYQHVVLVNSGEFGGSVAKAPYKEKYDKLITHVHGSHQVSISSFEMNMFDFREIGRSYRSNKKPKTRPAG